MSSCGLLLAHCEGLPTSKEEKQEQLTHEHCIKQACVMTVNSSSTLLTTTASAILDVCQKYTESLANLVGLLEQSLLLDGNDFSNLRAYISSNFITNHFHISR